MNEKAPEANEYQPDEETHRTFCSGCGHMDQRSYHTIRMVPCAGPLKTIKYIRADLLATKVKEAREAAFDAIGRELLKYGPNIRKVDLMARFQELFREQATTEPKTETLSIPLPQAPLCGDRNCPLHGDRPNTCVAQPVCSRGYVPPVGNGGTIII